MSAEGLDPDETRAAARAASEAFLEGGMTPTDRPADVAARLAEILGEDNADRLVRMRNRVIFDLHDQIAAELGVWPGPNAPELVVSAGASVYDTGAAIGADPAGLAARADRLLMHLLTLSDRESEATTARMVDAVAGRASVDIGVAAYGPDDP